MKRLYNILIVILAIASIVFAILDLSKALDITKQPYAAIDTAILLFFTVDYAVRFFAAKNRKQFFRKNIVDLIAIIPFYSILSAFRVFRIFRVLRLTKLAKLTRVLRAAAFFGMIKTKAGNILRTNGFLYVLYANIGMVLISTVIMMFAEGMTFGNALWWSVVTCTTVGYGDISPSSSVGRIVAIILMLFGIGMIGMLTGSITTYFSRSQEKENKKADPEKLTELSELIDIMTDEQKQKLLEIGKIIIK